MGGLELNHWTRCTVNMVHKTELTTKSVIFSPRVEIEDTSEVVWPLLLDISRIGSASDPSRILQTGGEVRIIDAIGSFGVERKFSDLLERYSLVDQELSIEYQTTAAGDYNPSSFTDVFVGKIQDWSIDVDRPLPVISIRFKPKLFNNRYITKKIDPVLFPNAPTRNYFKTLPVVIGDNIQVRPIQIAADGDGSPEYAYATTFGSVWGNGGVGTFFAKDVEGNYQEVVSASAVGTTVFSDAPTFTTTFTLGDPEYAFWLSHDPNTDNYVMTQVDVEFNGQGAAGTYNGNIVLNVYEGTNNDKTIAPGRLVATGNRNTNDLETQIEGASDFDATFTLRASDGAPLVMTSNAGYWIGITFLNNGGSSGVQVNLGTVSGNWVFRKDATGWRRFAETASNYGLRFKFYGCKFTDTGTPGPSLVDNEGKGYSYFEITQNAAVPGHPNPDLTKLQLLIAMTGLIDDGSGTVTGTINSRLNTTKEAINLLEREWNGSTWAATGNWDFAAYSDTHSIAESTTSPYYRQPQGATTGDITFEAWLADICENTAARPVLQRNGTIGLYYWGAEQATSKVFTQENSKVTRITELESRYVMNRLIMAYQRKIESVLGFELRFRVEQTPQDYASVLNWYSTLNAFLTDLIGDSITLYGERPSAKLLFDWISDQTSAELVARYLLTIYNVPPRYVELEVPVSEFLTGELMDVVELKHPTLPTFLGSSPNTKAAQYDGELADITNGYVLTRAQRYRGQIESMTIDFNEDIVPTFGIATRLLLNTQDPT